MKNLKIKQRNKMNDGFLANGLTIYIEKGIVSQFNLNAITNEFESLICRQIKFS